MNAKHERIKALLNSFRQKHKHLLQRDQAKLLGVRQATLSGWFNDPSKVPSDLYLPVLCKCVGVTYEAIFDDLLDGRIFGHYLAFEALSRQYQAKRARGDVFPSLLMVQFAALQISSACQGIGIPSLVLVDELQKSTVILKHEKLPSWTIEQKPQDDLQFTFCIAGIPIGESYECTINGVTRMMEELKHKTL